MTIMLLRPRRFGDLVTHRVLRTRTLLVVLMFLISKQTAKSLVAKYKSRYADTQGIRRICAIFLNGVNSSMFELRNVYLGTYIGAWARRWTLLRRWCSRTLNEVSGLDMPIGFHGLVANYHYNLLRVVVKLKSRASTMGMACVILMTRLSVSM